MSTNYIDQITDTAGTTQDISESDSTRIFRATCSTAADTAAKVATLQTSNKNFSLATGVRVAVTFTYGNSATTPTLRVDGSSTGTAKTIAVASSATAKTTGNGTTYNTWGPYETVLFTYDGTYWVNGGSSRSIYNAYSQASSAGSGTVTSVGITNGGGLSISGSPVTTSGSITVGHSNSVTAGTAGTSSATSGSTLAVPYVTYDAQGHITATGTHTHTISGFLTSSSTLDATKLSGTIPSSCYTNTTYGIATNTTNGLVKPWYTHTVASTGPTTGNNTTAVAVNEITTTASRYYAVEADNAGRLFVNVPWTDNNTNYYHTTGSWSGLTYTATANGGVGALAFTIPTGTTSTTVSVGNHTHSYAASSSAGGSATYAATTADTTNALYPVGVTSSAVTTLKRDTSITFTGGTISCSGLTVSSVDHTITSSEYTTIANALDALV